MVVSCNHCGDHFSNKSKRDAHVIQEHVCKVIVGETTVPRTPSGFPCPCCPKNFKNPRTLKIHLGKKQLSCVFDYDSTDDTAPQTDRNESLSCLPVEPDALASTATAAVTTISTNISEKLERTISTTHYVSTASPSSVTSSTSSPLFSSIIFTELGISRPPTGDCLLFDGIDVSSGFYDFQLEVNNRLEEGAAITIEEHIQHMLALSSVLLLKPARTHEDLHKHIGLNTCEAFRRHILSEQLAEYIPFPAATRARLEEIMEQMNMDGDRSKTCTRLAASLQITALIEDDDLNSTNRILLTVRNMVEKLPRHAIEDGPKETELITRHLEAILTPLFEDLDNNIIFRWTSVSDEEKQSTTRPDASINILYGASLNKRIGCGEVKAQYQALNHRLVSIDLMRITVLAKAASDKHKLKAIFAFVVVGKYATFYVFSRVQTHLYTMCEIAHVQLPLTLDHVPLFLSQINKIVKVIACFQYIRKSGNHSYPNNPITLTDNMLHHATDRRLSRKRKSITSHNTH